MPATNLPSDAVPPANTRAAPDSYRLSHPFTGSITPRRTRFRPARLPPCGRWRGCPRGQVAGGGPGPAPVRRPLTSAHRPRSPSARSANSFRQYTARSRKRSSTLASSSPPRRGAGSRCPAMPLRAWRGSAPMLAHAGMRGDGSRPRVVPRLPWGREFRSTACCEPANGDRYGRLLAGWMTRPGG